MKQPKTSSDQRCKLASCHSSDQVEAGASGILRSTVPFAIWRLKRMTSPRLKHSVKRLLSRRAQSSQADRKDVVGHQIAFSGGYGVEPGVQWEQTLACLDCKWGIAIKPGSHEDQEQRISNEIIGRHRNLRDPAGQRVIKSVWRTEELYRGKYVDELPEIMFLSACQYTARSHLSPQIFGPDPQIPNNVSRAQISGRTARRQSTYPMSQQQLTTYSTVLRAIVH